MDLRHHHLFPAVVQAIETDLAQLAEFGVDPEPYRERLQTVAARDSCLVGPMAQCRFHVHWAV